MVIIRLILEHLKRHRIANAINEISFLQIVYMYFPCSFET
jgi:hypothetical protein